MTEADYATHLQATGVEVLFHRNRYWRKTSHGFYEPIHWLARLKLAQATAPTPLCWGFRAVLSKEDAHLANGSLPIHLLTDLQNYKLQSLSASRRKNVRKCYRRSTVIRLRNSGLLKEQGYAVFSSASERTAHEPLLSKEHYLSKLPSCQGNTQLVLAGLIEGKLGGYVIGYAVDGVAYIHDVRIASEAFSSCVGIGLIFEFIQICRHSQQIYEISYGLHSREDKSLCSFKAGMGFSVKYVPTVVQINLLAARLIQWRYPDKYYRLTGYA